MSENPQQPSNQDIMKNLRNQVKLAFSDGEEITLKVIDVYEKQTTTILNQLNSNALLITKFQEEFKKRKIDISHIINPPQPNQKERRDIEQTNKKVPSERK